MSEQIKHECAVALLCRRAPQLDTKSALNKLVLLLEKQHNRGQDGAGVALIDPKPVPGKAAYLLKKSASENPLGDLVGYCHKFTGDIQPGVLLGHLRYATYGRHEENFCHPFLHKEAELKRTLFLAGNFNLTNTKSLFSSYAKLGKHPDSMADGYLMCEWLSFEMEKAWASGCRSEKEVLISALKDLLPRLDGAYTLCGALGSGWSFAVRDANGIRPCFYHVNKEYAVVASERPAIQAAFNIPSNEVKELPPGKLLLVSPKGTVTFVQILEPREKKSCVFERIYFSRANDALIHHERKALGAALAKPILEAVGYDLEHTFFSYIPNSAQVAFHGLLEALFNEGLAEGRPVRFGQIAVKDAKFRTFIADAASRAEFYQHVYDVTYGLIEHDTDTLVVLDDSIVRGNTMKNAILPMLDRLRPKKVIIASSAPPIAFPDCYGIDMSSLEELIAFRALVKILKGKVPTTPETLRKAYNSIPLAKLSKAIADLLKPEGMRAEVEVIFQTLPALKKACPDAAGDWYFTGNYPTPGGEKVLKQAIRNYLEKKHERSY